MKTLPHNWQIKKLGEVLLSIENGYTGKQNADSVGYPISRIETIQHFDLDSNRIRWAELSPDDLTKYKLSEGDILFSHINSDEHIGKVAIFSNQIPNLIHGVNLLKLKARANLCEAKYLYYFLLTKTARNQLVQRTRRAVNQSSINQAQLKTLKIHLPPLSIQQAIVERLDALRQAQELVNKQISLADELFQSLLATELDPSHRLHRLGDIINPQYGYTEEAKDTGAYRFIRITDIDNSGELINSDKKYVDGDYETIKPYILENENLLVARTGATYGKILCWEEKEPAIFASYLIRLNPDKSVVLPKYLWAFSRTREYWRQANLLVTGAGQPQFNANKIKMLKIPIPSLHIQQAIVQKLQSVQDYKAKLMEQKTKLDELFAACLARAMKGELVKEKGVA